MTLKQWGTLTFLSAIWGGSFFFNAVLVKELGPLTITFGRTLLAAVTLIIITYSRGMQLPSSLALWGSLALMGLINNLLPFSLIAWGQKTIDSGLAAIFNATTPIWTVVLAHFLTNDEKLTWNKVAGVLLGLAGVVVLIGPEALEGLGKQIMAQVAVMTAAFCYACGTIYGRRFRHLPSLVVAASMLLCTAIMSLPVALVAERFWTVRPSLPTLAALLGLALLSTATAYIFYFRLLAEVGSSNLSLVTLLIPVSALLLGIFFLDETLTASLMIGMGLIAAGLLAIDGRIFKRGK